MRNPKNRTPSRTVVRGGRPTGGGRASAARRTTSPRLPGPTRIRRTTPPTRATSFPRRGGHRDDPTRDEPIRLNRLHEARVGSVGVASRLAAHRATRPGPVARCAPSMVFNPARDNEPTTTSCGTSSLGAGSEIDIEVQPTKQRGHATHLVAGAVHDDVDVVFVLGGDGTANEVIQALAGTDVLLGIIPGGGANVLARALGCPTNRSPRPHSCSRRCEPTTPAGSDWAAQALRYFGFNAGFGFDAAVVRHVEQHTRMKRASPAGRVRVVGDTRVDRWIRARRPRRGDRPPRRRAGARARWRSHDRQHPSRTPSSATGR
jgi:hypothetical protein